ncbi:AraC family transcriptional regulator [Tenacibaculum xiamenense]|uniref:AraC family transcriptional regulator n=1 Tax=Tenacibaculum xiamenense TaxID=1261553 RepID=UPI0038963740
MAIDYVNANLNRTISLEELATVCFFSPYHFHRVFFGVTGETVFDCTNRLRLEKVAKLLKYSSNSISIISHECGFSSPSVLSRAFKLHFGVSPSVYRSSDKLKNSKIRKELFQVNKYYCKEAENEFVKDFPVSIEDFPERRIAFMRVPNSFEEGAVLNALTKLVQWSKNMGLFWSETIFGMSKDDPNVTPKDKYTYEVCITIPEDFEIDAESDFLEMKVLPKCTYAIATVLGDFEKVATAINYLFNHWLITSFYEPEHLPGLEIFNDNEAVLDWSHFNMNLCIPIKEIKK